MKGNNMMRLIALMILVPAALAHFTGQIDLSQPTWLWLTLLAGLNALQSTFTGWCPASTFFGKDKNTGQCCATDTTGSCCDSTPKTPETKTSAGCCSSSAENNVAACGNTPSTSSTPASDSATSYCENGADCLDIKVLGTGCQNCTTTIKLIEVTAAALKVECCLTKVEDIAEIAGFGVMATPGVVINGKVVHSGSIPTKAQVTEWLSTASSNTARNTNQGS
jgi:hypothetical protein